MFCGNNNSCLWVLIIIILLFGCGGCNNGCGGCGNGCGCNNGCGNNSCGCGCLETDSVLAFPFGEGGTAKP